EGAHCPRSRRHRRANARAAPPRRARASRRDYGFKWNPHGRNARDLQLFVELLGFTPMQALIAATKWGGEIMGMAQEIGQVRKGYLADLLLVDGDPLADLAILQDR